MEFTLFITPLFLFILGVIISTGKSNFLIAGYNTSSNAEKSKINEKALSKFIGKILFLIAFIQCLLPLFILFDFTNKSLLVLITTVLTSIVAISGVIYINTGNRFTKK